MAHNFRELAVLTVCRTKVTVERSRAVRCGFMGRMEQNVQKQKVKFGFLMCSFLILAQSLSEYGCRMKIII